MLKSTGEEKNSGEERKNKDEKEDEKKSPFSRDDKTNDGAKEMDSDEASMNTLVLEPDHPMMERFQIALKNHLLKQIDKLNNQVCELDNEVKKKEKEKEVTGLELYAAQQEIFRQQKHLDDCESAIECLMKERESLDESVKNKKTNWKEEVDKLNCAKKKEMDLIAELNRLSTVEKQMEKWEKEIESELTITQRISEKTIHDKNKLIEEKRKMDLYLLRLMTTISNQEAELRLLEGEIDAKMEEKDSLNQTLADAAADLQALITEEKRLMTAWNAVAAMINQKSTIYANLTNELTKFQDSFRSLNMEIESFKKSSAEEMRKSEKLAVIFGRVKNDFRNVENTLNVLIEKKMILEDRITSTAAMIETTEAEHALIKAEKEKIEGNLNTIKSSHEKLCQEHKHYEDEAMKYLQELIFNDKAAAHMSKMLKEAREKNRKQEFALLETENKISRKFLEVEELKETISQNNEIIKDMNKELAVKEEELKKFEEEIERCRTMLIQKQGNYAILTRKVEKYSCRTSFGKSLMSPTQQRINELERANVEIQTKNDKMQSFWLIQQSNNVKLSQKRNEQLKEISLLRRQVLLLEQRTVKTEREFMKEKKIENDVNKLITQFQHKLVGLNELLVGKKGYKENLGKENSLVQAQFVQNLKDSELEQIRLKDEIKELENNLEELAETMLATQREMLAWERKIQMAVEAKNDMQNERSHSGDLGQMKAEIHRMEVRYGQLKKVQEKLVSDLEMCVFKRDVILDGVDAMEKRRGTSTRLDVQKKLETIRNNIRSVRNERKKVETAIENTEEGHELLRKCIKEKCDKISEMNETTKKIDAQLEDGKLRKCQNLEMLIRRQKKCKFYEQVKNGKYRMLFKNESVLDNELQKYKSQNENLVSIMEALIEDFPRYRFSLKKISNTFEAKPS